MAVEVDYYEILGLSRSGSDEEIKEAAKKQMRQWRKRTEASNLEVRQEAEVRVKLIDDARATLTDAGRRRAYDERLQREGVKQPDLPTSSNGAGWIDQARHFLTVGDYHSAAYAAREATQLAGNTAESWYLRSRANAGLDRLEDAWYESQQATQIESNNAEYRFNVGMVAEGMGRFDAAIRAYKEAGHIDPQPMYDLSVGSVLLQTGRAREGLDVISRVHGHVPDDETANFYLAAALLETAESVPRFRDRDSYMVTSREEIDEMRSLVSRVHTLKHLEPDMHAEAQRIEAYLADSEKRKFNRAPLLALGALSDGGCAAIAILSILPVIPFLMVVFGFGMMADGSAAGFLILLIGAGAMVGEFFLFFQPQWKINRSIARTG